MLERPLIDMKVTLSSRPRARVLVPRAPLLARPLKYLQMALPSRVRARVLIPRATLLAQPLEDVQLAAQPRRRTSTRHTGSLPRAHFSISSWPVARLSHTRVPRQTLLVRPLEDVQIPILSRHLQTRRQPSPHRETSATPCLWKPHA